MEKILQEDQRTAAPSSTRASLNTAVGNAGLNADIKRAVGGPEYLPSGCTGAFLLHQPGFLSGKRATTHWAQLDELRALGDVTVEEERWVHDGNVITAAGVSAGIDMALYLVGVIKSPEKAREVQHLIEYYPAPPYVWPPKADG